MNLKNYADQPERETEEVQEPNQVICSSYSVVKRLIQANKNNSTLPNFKDTSTLSNISVQKI